MKEGPIQEHSYYFPADEITRFMQTLPSTDAYEDQYLERLPEKIVVMTHDDTFDEEMYRIERSMGMDSTWFLLTSSLDRDIPEDADLHIHFNKEESTLSEQTAAFAKRFGRRPRFNRNHRLLWRANNFDFPLMAMHGIVADTSLIGTRPFRPVIHGKVLPIWELPFCIADSTERFMASYSTARNHEVPFEKGLSPIVVLSHPFEVCRRHGLTSCFHDVITHAGKHGYRVISLSSFYSEWLGCRQESTGHTD